jgi:hypothetical protein
MVNGKVYLIGGRTSTSGTQIGVHNRTNEYDPVTRKWTLKAWPPVEMNRIQSVSWDGKVLIAGGFYGTPPRELTRPEMYIYEQATDSYSTRPFFPNYSVRRRAEAGFVLDPNTELMYLSYVA